MSIQVVPSNFVTEITPGDISLQTLPSVVQRLYGIDNLSHIAYFLYISQQAGRWVGVVWQHQATHHYSEPTRDFISEISLDEVWVYELSHQCLRKLYEEQQKQTFSLQPSMIEEVCPIIRFIRRLSVEEYVHA